MKNKKRKKASRKGKSASHAWSDASRALQNHRMLHTLFVSGPILLALAVMLLVIAFFAGVIDRTSHWDPSIPELVNGNWTWKAIPWLVRGHKASFIPVGIVLALLAVCIGSVLRRYYLLSTTDKVWRQFSEVSKLTVLLLFVLWGFVFTPTKNPAWLAIGTMAALMVTSIGLVESMVVGHRIQKIFGFHSYVKEGVDVYATATKWVCSVVANWEISKQLETAMKGFAGKETWVDENDHHKGKDPLQVRFCGPVNEKNMLGLFWRCGIFYKPSGFHRGVVFEVPKDSNTIRFTANEREVLLASTPTKEERDLYGFLYRDAILAGVYKRIYENVISTSNIEDQICQLLSKPYSDEAPNPYTLGKSEIDRYLRDVKDHALPEYLDQLKKDGLNPQIDEENGKDMEKAMGYIRAGLMHFLLLLQTQGKLKLADDKSSVEKWNCAVEEVGE